MEVKNRKLPAKEEPQDEKASTVDQIKRKYGFTLGGVIKENHWKMENACKEEESELLRTGIFELPGEPAIVINGVPPLPPNNDTLVPSDLLSGAESHRTSGFGEWLKGREVRKLFGDQFYNGKVTEFDRETGWYRVVYEDGDFEDLEWHELEGVLLPLDITVPLKALSLKIIRKRQRSTQRLGKTLIKPRNH